MGMPGREFNKAYYRYSFNGKEEDNEIKGAGNQYDYGFRIYDSRLGRFLTIDPLTKEFPWYTSYQFAGNKPIWAVDLDGAEESISNTVFKIVFGSPVSFSHARTPLEVITKERLQAQTTYSNSKTGRFLNGAYNTTAGIVGAVGSVSYIMGSEGTGAALGGVVALQFSLSQASIGVTQMTNALFGSSNKVFDNSSNVPGLIAYGLNYKSAAYIDAIGSLIPSITMSGNYNKFLNLKGYAEDGFGVVSTAEKFANTMKIKDAFATFDQAKSVGEFVVESFKLESNLQEGKLAQKLEFILSYKVKRMII